MNEALIPQILPTFPTLLLPLLPAVARRRWRRLQTLHPCPRSMMRPPDAPRTQRLELREIHRKDATQTNVEPPGPRPFLARMRRSSVLPRVQIRHLVHVPRSKDLGRNVVQTGSRTRAATKQNTPAMAVVGRRYDRRIPGRSGVIVTVTSPVHNLWITHKSDHRIVAVPRANWAVRACLEPRNDGIESGGIQTLRRAQNRWAQDGSTGRIRTPRTAAASGQNPMLPSPRPGGSNWVPNGSSQPGEKKPPVDPPATIPSALMVLNRGQIMMKDDGDAVMTGHHVRVAVPPELRQVSMTGVRRQPGGCGSQPLADFCPDSNTRGKR